MSINIHRCIVCIRWTPFLLSFFFFFFFHTLLPLLRKSLSMFTPSSLCAGILSASNTHWLFHSPTLSLSFLFVLWYSLPSLAVYSSFYLISGYFLFTKFITGTWQANGNKKYERQHQIEAHTFTFPRLPPFTTKPQKFRLYIFCPLDLAI